MMRVVVYAIAKNEVEFVERWAASAKDADHMVVCDTGSTDGTQEALRAAGVTVHDIHVSPWRFDVARNASLALLPADVDYCIALDLDEVLVEGWREHLETLHHQGVTRPRYHYVWSWNADGTPGLTYNGDKIHTRHGYRWVHPVHETLRPYIEEKSRFIEGLEIQHHPDDTKSKGSYLPLLALSVKEDPHDDRNAHYYARELFFGKQFKEAAAEFRRHLALPEAVWEPERAASMRYLAKCEPDREIEWLTRAVREAPNSREPWVDMAKARQRRKEWVECYAAAVRALAITERDGTYLNEPEAWGAEPHDNAALASYYLGRMEDALRHGNDAVRLSPNDRRLQENLRWYSKRSGPKLDNNLNTSPKEGRHGEKDEATGTRPGGVRTGLQGVGECAGAGEHCGPAAHERLA